jgi:predicted CDP-diglyceride synthetase/phosphatidate cytidylyltransferase
MDPQRTLTDQEKKFLSRAARRRSLFLLSSIATVVVAATIFVYHGLVMKDMNGPRYVIILLLLLSGRSYLRLYKSATIFGKLRLEPAMEPGRD